MWQLSVTTSLLAAAVAVTAAIHGESAAGGSPQPHAVPKATLTPAAIIAAAATRGEVHRYEVILQAGDFIEVRVTPEPLLSSLSLTDGRTVLREIDLPGLGPLPQRIGWIASVEGPYFLDVALKEPFAVARREADLPPVRRETSSQGYVLQVDRWRQATPEDIQRNQGFELLAQAHALTRTQRLDAFREAIPKFREAAVVWRGLADVHLEIVTLKALSTISSLFSIFRRDAAAAQERLIEAYGQLGDDRGQLVSWRQLADEYYEDGRVVDAKRAQTRALELASRLELSRPETRILRDIGLYESQLGNYGSARELAQRAIDRAAASGDVVTQGYALSDLAAQDELAGDLDSAIARNRRALALVSSDIASQALITRRLGFLHLRRNELDDAQSRLEARLALSSRFVDRDSENLTRLGLGDIQLARGDRAGARQRDEAAAAALAKGAQTIRCIAEQRLGRMDLEDGQEDPARTRFETMLEIGVTQLHAPCEAEARAGLADIAARRGDLEVAENQARRGVELAESFRQAVPSLESRALGFDLLAPAYERAVEITMRSAERGDDAAVGRALELNEQTLARGLLDRVLEAQLDAKADVSLELAARQRKVREDWRARLLQLQTALRTRPASPDTRALAEETRLLGLQERDLAAQINRSDARHASFVQPQPLPLDAIQALLDKDTLLLEYALGEARSFLWVVDRGDVHVFTLPPRRTIDEAARRVHEDLRTPSVGKSRFGRRTTTAGGESTRARPAGAGTGRSAARRQAPRRGPNGRVVADPICVAT